jgi:enoyl-CoA hydratase/carnithine racemase
MSTKRIAVERNDRVGTVYLDRPEAKNSIDTDMYLELCETMLALGRSDDIDVVVVRGRGDCFSVGEDLDALAELDKAGRLADWYHAYQGFVHVTWHLPKMVLAAVFGDALGIACELALLADVTYAETGARFGHPEAAVGITAPTIWPWLAGPKISKEYLSSGRLIGAEEAARVRLINRALPADSVDAEIDALARDYASMPPGTAVANKRRLNWAYRDVSRVLLDDLSYGVEFGWLVENRGVDASFYDVVRERGVRAALQHRNAPFIKS